MNLNNLKASILEDGKIDASEVAQIKQAIYEDGKIDREEADFLFELNDACSDANNDPSWESLFVDAICDYLLNDDQSPGIVDEDEAMWLLDKIQGDGKLDKTEKRLIDSLIQKSKSLPESIKRLV